MKTVTSLLLCLLISGIGHTQQNDTIFYNANWKKTSKEYASFYRPLPLEEVDGKFLVKDFYQSGQLQMQGTSMEKDKDVFDGLVTWYYANGTKQYERTYKNGRLHGKTTGYFKNGEIKTKGTFKDGHYEEGSFDNACHCPFNIEIYQNGARVEKVALHDDTKTTAIRQFLKYFDQVEKEVFYDKKGGQIGEVHYKNLSGSYLSPTSGTKIHFAFNKNHYATQISAKSNYQNDRDAVQETIYGPNGKFLGKGSYRNDYPFEGKILRNGSISTYVDGRKEGIEECCFDYPFIEASGVNRNNQKYDGAFHFNKTVTKFKNGLKHGEETKYDNNFNLEELSTYVDGLLEGKKSTKNSFTGTLHHSVYSNNFPLEGEVYRYNEMVRYAKGKEMMRTSYKDNGQQEITHFDEKGSTTARKFITSDTTYTLTYKDGAPHQGIELQPFGYVTYKNGAYEGPFLIEDKKQNIYGNYKNFQYHDTIYFVNKRSKDSLFCLYHEGKPVTGTDAFSGIVEYKAGKKNGRYIKTFNNRSYQIDSMAATYLNSRRIGEVTFYHDQKLVAKGEYKNGKPYQGVFYDEENGHPRNRYVYESGLLKKVVKDEFYSHFKRITMYEKGMPVLETILDRDTDTLQYRMTFKKGQPHTGQIFIKDSLTDRFVLNTYKNGKKDGIEQHSKRNKKGHIFKQFTHKNGKLNGPAFYGYAFSKEPLRMTFKKGKPYQGRMVTEDKAFLTTSLYDKGTLVEQSYYTYSKFTDKQKPIDTLVYQAGEPFEGKKISKIFKNIVAQNYEQGTLTQTDIDPNLNPYQSYQVIVHTPLRDSLVWSNRKVIIDYDNNEHNRGSVQYFRNDSLLGGLKFKGNKITDIDFKMSQKEGAEYFYMDGSDKIINELTLQDYKAVMQLSPDMQEPVYLYLSKIDNLRTFQQEEVLVSLYLETFEEPLVTLTFKDGKPFQGTIFYPSTSKVIDEYELMVFEKGKRLERKRLTKEALIKTFRQEN